MPLYMHQAVFRRRHYAILSALFAALLLTTAHAQSLRQAVVAGDLTEVQRLLEAGSSSSPDDLGAALYFAAQRGHVEIVGVLIENGAELNFVTKFGTPLQIAARGNHVRIVEMLLENGANPDLGGGEKMNSPLHDAAERGSVDAARLLLERGADVNDRNDVGHPPVHLAASKGKAEMVALLLEHGASPMTIEPIAPGELASANVEDGRVRAIECGQCHALEPGARAPGPYPGPNLWGIVGREKASMPDYPYSDALLSEEGSWTYDELNRFIADPTGFAPGTNMGHGFEPDRSKRLAVIAYLRTLSDDPLPLE